MSNDLVNTLSRSVASVESPRGTIGTAFVADDKGSLITDAHVVMHDRELRVTLSDGKSYPARIKDINDLEDLAKLELIEFVPGSVPQVKMGKHSQLSKNQSLTSLGFPGAADCAQLAEGSYLHAGKRADLFSSSKLANPSARSLYAGLNDSEYARYDDGLSRPVLVSRMDARPGHSGAPVVDEQGFVRGVVFARNLFDANQIYLTPVEAVHKLLSDEKPSYRFQYKMETDRAGTYIRENPTGFLAMSSVGTYLGAKTISYLPRSSAMIFAGIGAMALSSDYETWRKSAAPKDQMKSRLALLSDASLLLAASACMGSAPLRALLPLSIAAASRIASHLIPNRLCLQSIQRVDGSSDKPVEY